MRPIYAYHFFNFFVLRRPWPFQSDGTSVSKCDNSVRGHLTTGGFWKWNILTLEIVTEKTVIIPVAAPQDQELP